MEYSDVEISQYLGVSDPDFPLKSARLSIEDKGIVVRGKTSTSIFALPVEVTVVPKVENGKLTFIMEEVSAGIITLPSFLRDQLNSYLDNIMKSKKLYDTELEIITASTSGSLLKIEVHKKL